MKPLPRRAVDEPDELDIPLKVNRGVVLLNEIDPDWREKLLDDPVGVGDNHTHIFNFILLRFIMLIPLVRFDLKPEKCEFVSHGFRMDLSVGDSEQRFYEYQEEWIKAFRGGDN